MSIGQREGVLIQPHERLSAEQIALIDGVSRELLENPGVLSTHEETVRIFKAAGAKTADAGKFTRIQIPSRLVDKVLDSAPSRIVLGARNPDNRLVLDASEPRVRFGSGSETNVWLETAWDGATPRFTRRDGCIKLLSEAAHLCENLEHLDFFIRCVNIQDKEVTESNKDVNKFLASLNNITKHVQAGLTSLSALDDVMRLGRAVAGGDEAFEKNPVLSFITCVIKSPLEFVPDTADKLIAISKKRAPVVISSCPLGGTTGPFDEFGMVAQINAELLAGVALNQLVAPGAPVLYGSVPVRTRLDTLDDMYGAPEFNHYNIDCGQLARFYGLPCYSTAGVADTTEPGIQATVEKLMTLMSVPWSGAQYIHYAFGLLSRTAVFSPEQAVMDDVHIGIVKRILEPTGVSADRRQGVVDMIREVMGSSNRTFMYHLPVPTKENVYVRYPLEHKEGGALRAAHEKLNKIMERPRNPLPEEIRTEVERTVAGVLPKTWG
ncbi:MAG: trimethylamine methyltransferase family protein [Candidatus Hydrogenedentota bacterium]